MLHALAHALAAQQAVDCSLVCCPCHVALAVSVARAAAKDCQETSSSVIQGICNVP
jgi:hypothetical protein